MRREARMVFFDRLNVTVTLTVVLYAGIYLAIGARLSSFILVASALLFYPLILILRRKRHEVASRLLFIVSCCIYIAATPLGIGQNLHVEYYFFPAMMMPLLLFDPSGRRPMVFGVTIPIVSWALLTFISGPDIPEGWAPRDLPVTLFQSLNFMGAAGITVLSIRFYADQMRSLKIAALADVNQLNRELQALFDSVPIGIVRHVSSGAVVRCNQRAPEILGMTEAQLLGKTSLDPGWRAIREDQSDLPGEEHPAMVALSTGIPQLNRLMGVHRPNGELRWLLATAVPILMEEQSKREVIVTFNDVTQERLDRDALELERSKSIHTAKLATLGEMAAGIAHEINNPLGIISGSVNLAERYRNDPEKVAQKLEAIKKAMFRISKIVGGLRKFSRTNDSKVHSVHSLASIVEEAVVLTEYKAKRGTTLVQVTIESRENIQCDEIEIQQILINLINNGLDAVKDLEEKWVNVRVFDDSGEVVLRVQDSGPGIPDEIASRLFQPFFTTKPVGEGTGLGLSIVKGIVDEHKGGINVMTLNSHTCFEIRLPKHFSSIKAA